MLSFIACGGEDASKQGKEYLSAYICPMHCAGSGHEQAGKCPTCKMDYVKNEDFKGEIKETPKVEHAGEGHDHSGHDHSSHSESEGHEGHDHTDHSGHNHD